MSNIFQEISEKIEESSQRAILANNIIDYLKNKKVVIYGCGTIGNQIGTVLPYHGINICSYVDRRYNPESFYQFMDKPVVSPENISSFNNEDTVVIIAVTKTIIKDLDSGPIAIVQKLAPKAKILENAAMLNFILSELICSRDMERFSLLDCLKCLGAEGRKICEYYSKRCKKLALKVYDSDEYRSEKFYWFGYLLSQKCTLKCKLCCEKVPYIKNGIFVNSDTVIADCDKVAKSCRFLDYVELIGGEPFLHPNIYEIVTGLLQLNNIGYVKIFTNGTVVPSERMLRLLQSPRLVVTFSNYLNQVSPALQKNIKKTKQLFDEYNVKYVFVVGDAWSDYGDFTKRNLSLSTLEEKCPSCFIHNCHRLFQGKLYQCPIHYSFLQMTNNGNDDEDVVNIYDYKESELAVKLDEVAERKSFAACDHCLLPYDGVLHPAGEQL